MGWQLAQAEAVVGKPAVMWFGTAPPMVAVFWIHRLVATVTVR